MTILQTIIHNTWDFGFFAANVSLDAMGNVPWAFPFAVVVGFTFAIWPVLAMLAVLHVVATVTEGRASK